jgi:hypothetical protein
VRTLGFSFAAWVRLTALMMLGQMQCGEYGRPGACAFASMPWHACGGPCSTSHGHRGETLSCHPSKKPPGRGTRRPWKREEAAMLVSPCFDFIWIRDRHVVQSLVVRRTGDARSGAGVRGYRPVKDEVTGVKKAYRARWKARGGTREGDGRHERRR